MSNDAALGRRLPEADEVEKLKQQVKTMMPKEFGDAARLMAQPIAGAAALSALGFGVATQAFGLWLTAVSSAMRVGHEIAHAGRPGDPSKAGPAGPSGAASARARETADAVIADAKAAATDAGDKVVKFVSKAERAAKAPKRRTAAPAEPVAAPPMAAKPAKARAKAADDLKAIGGIGPKLEAVLNGLGIRTYAQIAALTDEEIASIEDQLGFKGRIGRDDWIGQAKALMSGGRA